MRILRWLAADMKPTSIEDAISGVISVLLVWLALWLVTHPSDWLISNQCRLDSNYCDE